RRGFRFNAEIEKNSEISLKEVSQLIEQNQTIDINLNKTKFWQMVPRQTLFLGTIIFCGIVAMVSFYAWQTNLKANVIADQQNKMPDRGTKSIEAYQAYLRGRELWQTRDNSQMEQGIVFFKRAIEIDSNYASPYIGIADSLSMMRDDAEDQRQAEEYIQKALTLQPNSAEAHATLGFILAMNKWQWKEAESEFQKALALDENSAKSHQWYATLLLIGRRFNEAERHLKRAIEIEPLSPNYNADLCELYYFANRGDQLMSQCRTLHELNPSFPLDTTLTSFYINQKRYDEAVKEAIETGIRHGVTETQIKNAAWYKAYQKDGIRGWILANINKPNYPNDSPLNYYNQSLNYAQLGEREKTIEYLEKAFDGHAFMLPFANARPEFNFIRNDSRFQNLMQRSGLNQN
ncbi:MAG TPA: hypothetical protein PKY82_30555, partial [Pyrinomonadaceae bacterium]|nr:hypothetical protein [Pyrinomonadaceae bacterium]